MSGHSFYDEHKKGRNLWYIWLFGGFFIWIASKLGIWIEKTATFNSSVDYPTTLFFQAFFESSNTGKWFYSYLLGTIPFLLALWLIQTKMRKRPFHKLIQSNPWVKFRWKRFVAGVLVFVLLMGLYWLIYYILFDWMRGQSVAEQLGLGEERMPRLDMFENPRSKLYFFTLVMLPFVALNALAQEMAFRGFLDQGLTKYMKKPFAVFLLSALIFAIWHLSVVEIFRLFNPLDVSGPTAKSITLLYAFNLVIFGFLMSVLTYMDKGIEAAAGMHFAGNFFIETFHSPTELLLKNANEYSIGYEVIHLIDTLVFYLLALIILAFWRFGLSGVKITNE